MAIDVVCKQIGESPTVLPGDWTSKNSDFILFQSTEVAAIN